MSKWIRAAENVFQFSDSCQVYAVNIGSEMLIVNAGTGDWLDSMDELPKPVRTLALTHFFRDHSAGALLATHRGIDVWAPYWEQEQLADPQGLFSRRETYIIYDNGWDLFSPMEPIPISKWLQDWETLQKGSATITVLPTPGVSLGAITLGVELHDKRIAFCGELIHAPGKILRVAPLQYNYSDLSGAHNVLYSIDVVRKWGPSFVASSTGVDLIDRPDVALQELDTNIRSAFAPRPGSNEAIEAATHDGIDSITPHLCQSRYGGASAYFLMSESKKALAIDYGYRDGLGHAGWYAFPRNRRPLLHGIDALKVRYGIDGIDAVMATHFHDDHVSGIPMLQRLYGTRCFAGENFAHILADPERYAFPCTWPEPIKVEPVPLGEPFQWEEYQFRLHPISGHTRFSTLVEFEVDRKKIVATGDQYLFIDSARPGESPSMHNHVFRNGAVLSSFAESTAKMKEIHPDIILPGHGKAYHVPEELYDRIETYTRDYEQIHRDLMVLGDNEIHFEVDSRAAWIEPYRVRLDEPAPIEYVVQVRNPYATEATLEVTAVVPAGWSGSSRSATLGPRAEGTVEITVIPAKGTQCRRQPIAVELKGPDRSFGQVAEALVSIGFERF